MAVSLPDDIIDLEEEVDKVKLLVIGESGAGKTPFGASSARTLILRTEKGTASALVRGSKAKVWDCTSWVRFNKAKKWLSANVEKDGFPFDWVTLDSVNMLQTRLLRNILATEFKANPSARSLDIPQIQDHQLWQNKFKRTMEELVDLPINVCATALPMVVETEDEAGETETNILPQVLGGQGAIAWVVAGMFDMGGRIQLLRNDEGKRFQRLHFEKNANYWGRDRWEACGAYLDNPTLDMVHELAIKKMKG